MPFAVVALILGAVSLGGFALSSNSEVAAAVRSVDATALETWVVGIVAVVGLVVMLVPGALVRVLYGRRPALPGALTAEERAMTRFDREEAARRAGEEV